MNLAVSVTVLIVSMSLAVSKQPSLTHRATLILPENRKNVISHEKQVEGPPPAAITPKNTGLCQLLQSVYLKFRNRKLEENDWGFCSSQQVGYAYRELSSQLFPIFF